MISMVPASFNDPEISEPKGCKLSHDIRSFLVIMVCDSKQGTMWHPSPQTAGTELHSLGRETP